VELRRFEDVRTYARRVEPFLLAHEGAHCLPLGILTTLRAQPDTWSDDAPYLALVEDDAREVVLVAMRTPPYNLILSLPASDDSTADALALVAADTHTRYGELPGVVGPAPITAMFASEWTRLTGASAEIAIRERSYQLDTVIPVAGVPGSMRRVTESDRDLLARWIDAFSAEAGAKPADPEAWADLTLAADPALRGVYVWEDEGAVVSLAGYSGPTARGMRIGPVYTPPELRGRGYASACTAALSQLLLDGGRRFVFLFTDLANPTSNKIYQQIGYRPVCDVDVYQLDLARSEEK
jgi:predicted GNAT family acetyltransferase